MHQRIGCLPFSRVWSPKGILSPSVVGKRAYTVLTIVWTVMFSQVLKDRARYTKYCSKLNLTFDTGFAIAAVFASTLVFAIFPVDSKIWHSLCWVFETSQGFTFYSYSWVMTAGQDPIEQSIFFYNLSPWITVYGPPSNEMSLMAQVLKLFSPTFSRSSAIFRVSWSCVLIWLHSFSATFCLKWNYDLRPPKQ